MAELFTAFVPVFARVFGCVVLIPFGSESAFIPRILLSTAFALLCCPFSMTNAELFLPSLIIEFGIGVTLGAPLLLVPEAARMFGELVDSVRGQSVAAILDPLGEHTGSDMAALSRLVATVAALHCGALELVLENMASSFQIVPPLSLHVESFVRIAGCSLCATSALVVDVMLAVVLWAVAFLCVELLSVAAALLVRTGPLSNLAFGVKSALFGVILLCSLHSFGNGGAGQLKRLVHSLLPPPSCMNP